MTMFVNQFGSDADSIRREVIGAVGRLSTKLGKDFLSASDDYKTAIVNELGKNRFEERSILLIIWK